MQYIEPASITDTNFKIEWQKTENEAIYETNLQRKEGRYLLIYAERLRASFGFTKRFCTQRWWRS